MREASPLSRDRLDAALTSFITLALDDPGQS
jgi:hypothetical protein